MLIVNASIYTYLQNPSDKYIFFNKIQELKVFQALCHLKYFTYCTRSRLFNKYYFNFIKLIGK